MKPQLAQAIRRASSQWDLVRLPFGRPRRISWRSRSGARAQTVRPGSMVFGNACHGGLCDFRHARSSLELAVRLAGIRNRDTANVAGTRDMLPRERREHRRRAGEPMQGADCHSRHGRVPRRCCAADVHRLGIVLILTRSDTSRLARRDCRAGSDHSRRDHARRVSGGGASFGRIGGGATAWSDSIPPEGIALAGRHLRQRRDLHGRRARGPRRSIHPSGTLRLMRCMIGCARGSIGRRRSRRASTRPESAR